MSIYGPYQRLLTDATLCVDGRPDDFQSFFDALTSATRAQLQLHGVCNLLRVTNCNQPMHAVTLCLCGKHVGCHYSVKEASCKMALITSCPHLSLLAFADICT